MLGSIQATFEGFTVTYSWHCACRKVHLAKQEHAYGDLLARVVPDTGALLTACGKASGCTPKHKGTASLEERQKESSPGKKAGRMVTFSSPVLSIAISTLMECLDFCQAVISAWWWSLRVKHHFSFLVHQNK